MDKNDINRLSCICKSVKLHSSFQPGPIPFLSTRTRLSLCSLLVQASMKVWAMTDNEASTTSDTWMSKMKLGFFRMFTQKRRGRLEERDKKAPCYCNIPASDQLFFQFIKQVLERWRRFTREPSLRHNRVQYIATTAIDRRLFSPTFI